jgi:hypothetical protein
MCPKIYKPVCSGGLTFGNSCEAQAKGFKTWVEGACRQGGEQKCPPGQVLQKPLACPPNARCAMRCVAEPKCGANERLILRGTPFTRCVPSGTVATCAKGQTRVCPRCITRSGSGCACFCMGSPMPVKPGKPGKPAPSTPGTLCPLGTRWEAASCPPNARCLIGGRCVPITPGKCPPGLVWKKTFFGVGMCMPGTTKPDQKRCAPGFELRQVMCIRAPCPALCVPTSKLPAKPTQLPKGTVKKI